MKQVDEIIYDAICADATIMSMIAYQKQAGGTAYAIKSTCFEVPPDTLDNTPVPYIIVHDSGFQNQQKTKDTVWEAAEDLVTTTVEIAADSPKEVKTLVRLVRIAIENYVVALYSQGERTPLLESLNSDGIDWDWTKPCYFQHLIYQCVTQSDTEDDEQD